MKDQHICCSAPGKIILFGEHAVVYGYPAIAVAIDRRVYSIVKRSDYNYPVLISENIDAGRAYRMDVTDSIPHEFLSLHKLITMFAKYFSNNDYPYISIKSDLPISSGLGSSAATSVALTKSLAEFYKASFTLEKISAYAFEAEKIQHGMPSGIDNTIATYGGGIYFKQGEIEKLDINLNAILVVADSKVPRSTKKLVEKVRKFKEKNPQIVNPILEKIGEITNEGVEALKTNNINKVGELMTENHNLLEELGVGHHKLSEILSVFTETGAIGGKLTGAGGGGCVVAIFDNLNDAQQAINKLEHQQGIKAFNTYISTKGVTCESVFCDDN